MISNIQAVKVHVRSLRRAFKFYTEQLGLEVIGEAALPDGQHGVRLRVPGTSAPEIALYQAGPGEPVGGDVEGITFRTANIWKAFQQLQAQGVTFIDPPCEWAGQLQALFIDQDATVHTLMQG